MSRPRLHTARSRRRRLLAPLPLALVLASGALAGCDAGPESAEQDAPPMLATRARLVEDGLVVREDARLERGARTVLDGTARPALTAARPVAPAVTCPAPSRERPRTRRMCSVTLPESLPEAPDTIFTWYAEPRPTPPGEKTSERRPRKSRLLGRPAPGTPLGELRVFEATGARLLQVPPLADRALTTEELVVPPGAVLRLSFGVEEPAWLIDSAPVYFRVSVESEDGQSQDLLRRILDPARKPAERRWFDVDVDLTDLAGRRVWLRFTTEPAEAGDERPSLPVWGDPRILAPEPESGRGRPSIVLVSLDTLRARSVSAYGYELETTPALDAFARQGALFENAFTTFSNTLPSHMSMLTGLYPATHAVLAPGTELGAQHATLAEILRRAGYSTAAFTEDALLDARYGFHRGFSTYFENTGIGLGAGNAAGTFGRALEWAGRHADERFFVFVHTYEVHAPYDPPSAYRHLLTAASKPRSDAQVAYEQEARRLDDELAKLLEGLRLSIPEDELLVILTADHGEEFGEHGLQGHLQIYDEVMHVPLVMVWPARIPADRRIATPVSLVDLVPTVLDLASLPPPSGLDGVSLVPLLGERPGTLARDVVFAEHPPMVTHPRRRFAARSATAKCLLDEDPTAQDLCFDLVADPAETAPRDASETAELGRVRRAADEYRARALEAAPAPRRGGASDMPSPTHAPGEPAPPPPDEQIERKLRALGYTE